MKTLNHMILAAAAALALVSAVAGYSTNQPTSKPVVVAFDDPVPQPNCPTWPEPCN